MGRSRQYSESSHAQPADDSSAVKRADFENGCRLRVFWNNHEGLGIGSRERVRLKADRVPKPAFPAVMAVLNPGEPISFARSGKKKGLAAVIFAGGLA